MTASIHPFRGRSVLAFAVAVVLSLAASLALTLLFGREAWPEILFGCVAAILNGLAHALIGSRSVGAGAKAFLRWGIVMNTLRIAIVLGMISAVCFMTPMLLAPFALSLVAGTVVFLTCNAVVLARTDGGGKNT